MARSDFTDFRAPLAKALGQVAQAGPAAALAPVWAEAVGAMLARRSRPVRLHDGTLTVEVAPEFLFDLERERAALGQRLRARLGREAVVRIHFVVQRSLSAVPGDGRR